MQLSLRPALEADIGFCESLSRANMAHYHAARGVEWNPHRFVAAWSGFENHLVVADDEVAGLLRLLAAGDALDIRDLQLLPAHRGKGIGTWAVARTINEAAARGFGIVRLRVFRESPALRLYRRLGFATDSVESDGKVHMSYAVSGSQPDPGDAHRRAAGPHS